MTPFDLLHQDVPAFDLTTHWLEIGKRPSRMVYTTRQSGVVSGLAAIATLVVSLGVDIVMTRQDGDRVLPGDPLLDVRGPAQALHSLWKTGLNLLEFGSGVATRTRLLVDRATEVNPHCGVFTTRKMIPGSRPWAIQAVLDGGGMPHRLGLSETILIFDQHKVFFSSAEAVVVFVRSSRHRVCEKKVFVEVSSLEEASAYAGAGVDGLQFDKVAPEVLTGWVTTLRSQGYRGVLIATGGVNADNVGAYAATGVDGVATSWVYQGASLDIGTSLKPIDKIV